MKLLVAGAESLDDVPGLDAATDFAEIHFAPDDNALATGLPGSEILLGWDFSGCNLGDHWHLADSLRWIHWCGAGVDRLLFPGLTSSDVLVTNARGIFDRAMAETVLGYMLAEAKRFRESWDLQKSHSWLYRRSDRLLGQHALVVGVGSIGHAVGELLQAVGVRVQGVGRTAREDDPVFGRIHDMADLNRLSAEQDWVIGVLPSTASTRDVFDAEFFAALSPRARFINIGRGDAVAEDALQQALQSGAIAGAMLDVFKQEPLPEKNPLWDTPNLFVSPHISGDYHSFPRDMVEMFLEHLSRDRSGDALATRGDKVQGYAARE